MPFLFSEQFRGICPSLLDDTVALLQQAMECAAARNIDVLIEIHPFTLGINLDRNESLDN